MRPRRFKLALLLLSTVPYSVQLYTVQAVLVLSLVDAEVGGVQITILQIIQVLYSTVMHA